MSAPGNDSRSPCRLNLADYGWNAPRDIGRTSVIPAYGSELLYVDPAVCNGIQTPSGKSAAGLEYPLPVPANVKLCNSIEVVSGQELEQWAMKDVATRSELTAWTITLVAPDSTVLHSQVPLRTFMRIGAVELPTFLNSRVNLFDPRQSFIQPWADGLETLVLLRLIYGA